MTIERANFMKTGLISIYILVAILLIGSAQCSVQTRDQMNVQNILNNIFINDSKLEKSQYDTANNIHFIDLFDQMRNILNIRYPLIFSLPKTVRASEILKNISIGAPVKYNDVIIQNDLNLSYVYPQKNVDNNSKVNSTISITNSKIMGFVNFSNIIFDKSVDFSGTQFSLDSRFENALFNENCSFENTQFYGRTDFLDAQFNRSASFSDARFHSLAIFNLAKFGKDASFINICFYKDSSFEGAQFNGNVGFNSAKFYGNASFQDTNFQKEVDFGRVTFYKEVKGDFWFLVKYVFLEKYFNTILAAIPLTLIFTYVLFLVTRRRLFRNKHKKRTVPLSREYPEAKSLIPQVLPKIQKIGEITEDERNEALKRVVSKRTIPLYRQCK